MSRADGRAASRWQNKKEFAEATEALEAERKRIEAEKKKQVEEAVSAAPPLFCGSTMVCTPTTRTLMQKRWMGVTKFATKFPVMFVPERRHCSVC